MAFFVYILINRFLKQVKINTAIINENNVEVAEGYEEACCFLSVLQKLLLRQQVQHFIRRSFMRNSMMPVQTIANKQILNSSSVKKFK